MPDLAAPATCERVLLTHGCERLRSFLEELRKIRQVEFPYPHSEQALQEIEKRFERHLSYLMSRDEGSDPSTVRAGCTSALTAISNYMPLLGFLLRSTNVRNAFESYRPLLRIARSIVGNDTRLVLSSEWDYTPFTYPYLAIGYLPDYVMIGLPASESSNPLLLPLAGHELGHSLWRRSPHVVDYIARLEQAIVDSIEKAWKEFADLFQGIEKDSLETDLFAKQTWQPAVSWSLRQVEETYCDFVGLRIFGESFLHAFAYLLSPSQEGQRSVYYPNTQTRVQNMLTAATTFGIQVPPGYAQLFDNLADPSALEGPKRFLMQLADRACLCVVDELVGAANAVVPDEPFLRRSQDRVQSAQQDFRLLVPARHAGSLANILNAAWLAYSDTTIWRDIPQVNDGNRAAILKELVLKSIEVLEIQQIVQ